MAPIIHLVRHAQGYHNLNEVNQQIPDPDLTPLGITQCEELCRRFDAHDKITHLVASPLRRTLYTCLKSFAPVFDAGKKVVALPDAQEISILPCDIGSEPSKLEKEFAGLVDLHLVKEGWNDKSIDSKYYPSPAKLEERSRAVRLWLRELASKAGDDAQIVLVTHGGILHFLTQDWDGVKLERGTWPFTPLNLFDECSTAKATEYGLVRCSSVLKLIVSNRYWLGQYRTTLLRIRGSNRPRSQCVFKGDQPQLAPPAWKRNSSYRD